MKKLLSNITFKKLIYNKRFLVAVSVIISIVIWFIAAIVRNPIREKPFADLTATISLEGTTAAENGLKIVNVPDVKFKVTIKGAAYVVSGVQKDDFTLKADVTDITEPSDNCVLKIKAEKNDNREYEFVSIEPATVTVKIVRNGTEEFDLTAATSETIKTDEGKDLVADTPKLTDTTKTKIKITGSLSEAAKIKSVEAVADYDGAVLSESKTFDAYIVIYTGSTDGTDANKILYRYSLDGKAYDAEGKEVANPELTPEFYQTKVTVNILKKKTLSVQAKFDNKRSDVQDSDINYWVDPAEVTVVGPIDVVPGLEAVTLEPIDYRLISRNGSNKFERKAVLKGGVRILGDDENEKTFTVKVTYIKDNKYNSE